MLECSSLNTLTSCLRCSHNLSEESHKSLEEFEHQAGLTESGYYPHKGLSAEETHIHRRGDVTLPVSINSFNHWPQVTMNSKENAHLNVICQKVVVIIITKSTLKKNIINLTLIKLSWWTGSDIYLKPVLQGRISSYMGNYRVNPGFSSKCRSP